MVSSHSLDGLVIDESIKWNLPLTVSYLNHPNHMALNRDAHKAALEKLYRDEDMTLNDAMAKMEERFGVHESKSTYERRLKEWGIQKNRPRKQIQHLKMKLLHRQKQNKESLVYIRGVQLTKLEIEKKVSRCHVSLIEQNTPEIWETPKDMVIITPTSDDYLHCVKSRDLPWIYFLGQLASIRNLNMLINMPEKTLKAILPALSTSDQLETMTRNMTAIMPVQQNLMEQMSRHLSAIMPIQKNDEIYPILRRLVGPDATATIEVLKLTVYLLSNKLLPFRNEKFVCDELLKWFQLGDNYLLLKAILSYRLPTIEAFAEGIFSSALDAVDRKMVKLFLDLGMSADIIIPDESNIEWKYSTALQFAIQTESLGLVELLLNSGASVDLIPKRGRRANPQTPLQIAARNRDMEIAQLLIDRGATVDGFNKWGLSALQIAATEGNAKLVEVLLSKGADINAQSMAYGCPLECAIRARGVSVVEMLLERGADINGQAGSTVNTPLQSVAMIDDHDIVLRLLDRGADANTPAPTWEGCHSNILKFENSVLHRPNRTALQWAAENGNLNICQILMDAGADPNAALANSYSGETGTTALVAAVTSNKYQVVELLLKHGADVNDERGLRTALETATRLDDKEMVQLILWWNPRLGNSVIYAVENQNYMLVSTLLKAGADINAVNRWNGKSALSVAAGKNDLDLVRFLLKEGADPNPKPRHRSAPAYVAVPLVAAARLGNLDMIDILLSAGAECNQQEQIYDVQGFGSLNALQAAAAKGNASVVLHLLAAGAELNWPAAQPYGLTALQAGVRSRNLELIQFMIHQGANLNSPAAERGVTALQAAVWSGNLELIQFMINQGANLNSPAAEGRLTALQIAVEKRNEGLVQILLDSGATPNDAPGCFIHSSRPLSWQLTSLQMAAANGDNDLVRRLLRSGADINWPADEHQGRTALQAASEFGHESTVQLLLTEGANANAPASGFAGLTALQAAANGGYLCIANALLKKEANVNALNPILGGGQTALEVALSNGRIDMIKLLLNAGADITSNFGRSQLKSALDKATQSGHDSAAKFLKYHQIH
ncbi:hypothetical protein G7Y89_g11764 [Cudoniella acicularis]|uniref:protein S-acyltransferase n=1 Tax=Cudoniella acicularis TaxID=354080 RepID=A0A8H4RBD6_9HELO|nr:hypothetical protein G7Y89_g11764 [Cudoniella acicularis]